jgi:hypothetical protein
MHLSKEGGGQSPKSTTWYEAMDDNDVDVTAIGVTDPLDSSCLVLWWEWMGVHLSDMNNAKSKLVEASEVVKKFSEGKFNTL